MDIPKIKRPSASQIAALKKLGAATIAGTLGHMGIRNTHMIGPVTQNPGKSIVGPARHAADDAQARRSL